MRGGVRGWEVKRGKTWGSADNASIISVWTLALFMPLHNTEGKMCVSKNTLLCKPNNFLKTSRKFTCKSREWALQIEQGGLTVWYFFLLFGILLYQIFGSRDMLCKASIYNKKENFIGVMQILDRVGQINGKCLEQRNRNSETIFRNLPCNCLRQPVCIPILCTINDSHRTCPLAHTFTPALIPGTKGLSLELGLTGIHVVWDWKPSTRTLQCWKFESAECKMWNGVANFSWIRYRSSLYKA